MVRRAYRPSSKRPRKRGRPKTQPPTKLKIWTQGYQPFIMGGDVHAPLGAEVEVGPIVEVGKGIQVRVVQAPPGKECVAEVTTGAIVGTSLEMVRDDIAVAAPAVILQQLEQAKQELLKVRWLTAEEFWRIYRR
jgi:hypothetical protein